MNWKIAAAIAAAYEGLVQLPEYGDRHEGFREARAYCRLVGKPLLRIGVNRSPLEPPNGDVTLDLDPAVEDREGGVVLGDERNMAMFVDGQFGVCFNEHTLEHLETANDVALAVKECLRVADYAMFLFPSRWSVWSAFSTTWIRWLGIGGPYGPHRLQIYVADGGLRVTPLEGPEADRSFTLIPIPNFQTWANRSVVVGRRPA